MESYDESTWQPKTANWHMTVDEKRKLSSTTDGCDDNEVADGRTVGRRWEQIDEQQRGVSHRTLRSSLFYVGPSRLLFGQQHLNSLTTHEPHSQLAIKISILTLFVAIYQKAHYSAHTCDKHKHQCSTDREL